MDEVRMRIPRRTSAMPDARAQLRSWLADCGLPKEDADEFLVAVGEAIANAIVHAPPECESPVEVTLSCASGQVEVRIRNDGPWEDQSPRTEGGFGFLLMRHLADEVAIDRRPDATTVTLRRQVRQTA